jgi:hypothetical protein
MPFYCSQADYLVSLVYVPADEGLGYSYGDDQVNSGDDQSSYMYGYGQSSYSNSSYGDESYGDDDGGVVSNDDNPLRIYTVSDFAEAMAEKIHNDRDNGDSEIIGLFHAAQFRSIMSMGSLYDAFEDLCRGQCTLFTVEFWGSTTSPMNFRGTPVYSIFERTAMTACANGLYRPEAFEPLVNKPPVTLVQGYYTCVPNRTVAIQRAVGISAGSAALYASFALNFLLFAVVKFYNLNANDKILNASEKKRKMESDFDYLKTRVDALEKELNLQRKNC